MVTFRRWLPLLVIGLLAGGLYAKNLKIKALIPAGLGVTENPDADGMAHINVRQSPELRSEVQVHVTDLLPNTTYGVQVDCSASSGPRSNFPQVITTNPAGNGHCSVFVDGFDLTQCNPVIRIYYRENNGNPSDLISFGELRAIGCASGNCPIGDPCTVDADCDDDFLCTTDTCNSGSCFHAEACADGNACTADFCNPGDGSCENDLLPGCTP